MKIVRDKNLRMVIAAELAKPKPLGTKQLEKKYKVGYHRLRRLCADMFELRKKIQVGIYAPKNGHIGFYLNQTVMDAGGARPGCWIRVKVVGRRRWTVTASVPGCNSLAIQRWGKIGLRKKGKR